MTDFRDKLKMFEANKTTPPQAKTRPMRTTTDQSTSPHTSLKNNSDETVKINITITNEFGTPPTQSDNGIALKKHESKYKDNDLINEDSDDYVYNFLESVYDLPGFEHFNFDIYDTKTLNGTENLKLTTEGIHDKDLVDGLNETFKIDISKDIQTEDIQLAPSPRLIEEIFNTSIWRNSANYSDDFIYAPSNVDATTESQSNNSDHINDSFNQSPLSLDERRKAQSSSKRGIFSSIFKSKKGSRKSADKISLKDNLDTDSLKDINDKNKSNTKNNAESDDKSIDLEPKKPLNSIFNRDWLNSIGDGIKKKASVMSELRKLFGHGNFKHLKKVHKSSYDVSV